MWRRGILIGVLTLAVIGLGAAIARQGDDPADPADPANPADPWETALAPTPSAADDDPRIVSLSPGITRTLVDLGLGRYLVGRTQYCRSFDDVPVVGDLHELDYETLVRLAPTHVLVQPSGGVAPRLRSLAADREWTLAAWSPLDDRTHIEGLIRDLPGLVFTPDDHRGTLAAAEADALLARFADAFRPAAKPAFAPETLLLIDGESMLAYGAGTYLADVLGAVGVTNVAPCARWCELSLEDLVRIDPALIVLVDDGAVDDPIGPSQRLASLPLAAIRNGRVVTLRHPDAMIPSSALIELAEQLRRILAEIENEIESDAA